MSLKEKMTALADAVREKAELTDTLTIDEMTEAVNGLVVNGIEVDERTLTVTPSKSQQNFSSSSLGENAYYGTVTVNAIPAEYITTADATAASSDILRGKTAYVNGQKVTGNMSDYGDVEKRFSNTQDTLSIKASGYYSSITVNLTRKTLEVTPTKSAQTLRAFSEGSDVFYTQVNVAPIPSEYITTTDATATEGTILEGNTAYVNGEKVTGKYIAPSPENVRYGVPFGFVDLLPDLSGGDYYSIGSFTADATAAAEDIAPGKTAYVLGGKVTGTMPSKEAETFTPGTSDITIPAGIYLAGDQTIKGDANLKAENIAEGVTLFGVEGSFKSLNTSDATVTASDLLSGVTAYGKDGKVTGTISTVTASLSSNVVTVPAGYIEETQTITVGTAKEAETFTPGTSDQTINAGTYLTGNQTIKGDANFTESNIADGVTMWGKTGTFTRDADATASDIAQGKIAYVKGEKITGTASGGAVAPYWDLRNGTLITPIPPCDAFGVPARGMGIDLKVFNGELWRTTESSPIQFDKSINWTYVYPIDNDQGFAIGDGKLFYVTANSSSATITPLFPSLSGITQVCGFGWGTLCCTESGELYGGGGNDFTKVRRVEYTRTNSTDPVVYVNVSKILNCSQNYQNFWVITDDGSLASGWLDKEAFDYSDGAAYAEIDTQSVANGNPFLNYFPQNVDEYGGDSTQTYELAFRADGLWYRQPGTYYDATDRTTKRYSWNKANDPGLRKYDWLGYCSMIGNASYEGYDEETGEDIYKYSLEEYAIALHIDEQGRLWKIAPKGEIISTEYEFVNFKLTGLSITQVGEDTDWQCVPPMMRKGYGGQDRPTDNTLGQKGGKVINMWVENTDTADIGWQEWRLSPPGRMVGCDRVYVYFAPEGASVDMSKAGGTF